jgi:hypothetical protein
MKSIYETVPDFRMRYGRTVSIMKGESYDQPDRD